MEEKAISIVILIVLNIFSIPTCSNENDCTSDKFTTEMNVDRIFGGIPTVNPTWKNHDCTWLNPHFADYISKNKAFYVSKELRVENGKLKSELDRYRSGKYLEVNGKLDSTIMTPEMMVIKHNYDIEPKWVCYTNANGNDINNTINLAQADSILNSWGIERLNYEFINPNKE